MICVCTAGSASEESASAMDEKKREISRALEIDALGGPPTNCLLMTQAIEKGYQNAHHSHDHIEDINNHFSELESDLRAIHPNLHFNKNENIHNLMEDVKKRMIGIGCNKEVNSAYDEMEPKVNFY